MLRAAGVGARVGQRSVHRAKLLSPTGVVLFASAFPRWDSSHEVPFSLIALSCFYSLPLAPRSGVLGELIIVIGEVAVEESKPLDMAASRIKPAFLLALGLCAAACCLADHVAPSSAGVSDVWSLDEVDARLQVCDGLSYLHSLSLSPPAK